MVSEAACSVSWMSGRSWGSGIAVVWAPAMRGAVKSWAIATTGAWVEGRVDPAAVVIMVKVVLWSGLGMAWMEQR